MARQGPARSSDVRTVHSLMARDAKRWAAAESKGGCRYRNRFAPGRSAQLREAQEPNWPMAPVAVLRNARELRRHSERYSPRRDSPPGRDRRFHRYREVSGSNNYGTPENLAESAPLEMNPWAMLRLETVNHDYSEK